MSSVPFLPANCSWYKEALKYERKGSFRSPINELFVGVFYSINFRTNVLYSHCNDFGSLSFLTRTYIHMLFLLFSLCLASLFLSYENQSVRVE